MVNEFERDVRIAKEKYKREKHAKPKYLIINKNTLLLIKSDIRKRQVFGLIDKRIYKGLYIAIDPDLEDYEFVITG